MAAKVKTFIYGRTMSGSEFIVTDRADIPADVTTFSAHFRSFLRSGTAVNIRQVPNVVVVRDTRKDSAKKRAKALLSA